MGRGPRPESTRIGRGLFGSIGGLTMQLIKKATQDGTYTVYFLGKPIAWGLSRTAADRLIERLRSPAHQPTLV